MKNNQIPVDLKVQKIIDEKFFVILVNSFFDKTFNNFTDAFVFMKLQAIKILDKRG